MNDFTSFSLGERPFIGISDEIVLWGGKHCAIKRIVISGKIYGCGDGPNTGYNILEAISGWQDTALDLVGYTSICESLEITNSDYLGAEYRAVFLAYPDDWFSDVVGILEPVDNVNISIGKDGLLTVRRTVSARAAGNNFDKVSAWISSLNVDDPPDISRFGLKSISSSPKSIIETRDRINGSISVEATFIQNDGSTQNTVLVYSVDLQYDDRAGIYSVTVSGTIEGNTGTDIGMVRDQIGSIGTFEIAGDVLSKSGAAGVLDPTPAALSFSENDETDTVNFSFTYNTFPLGGEKKYFTFTTDYDHIKDIVTISISGTVSFDSKISMAERPDLIKSIIDSYNFSGLCLDEYAKNSFSKRPLNIKNPVSYSITLNKSSDLSADVSVSYSNEDFLPDNVGDEFISFNYDIEINPSSDVLIPIQFTNGTGGAFDFKAKNRGSATIRGTAIAYNADLHDKVLDTAMDFLNEAIKFFNPEDELILEKNVTGNNISNNGYTYEFEIKKGAIFTIP